MLTGQGPLWPRALGAALPRLAGRFPPAAGASAASSRHAGLRAARAPWQHGAVPDDALAARGLASTAEPVCEFRGGGLMTLAFGLGGQLPDEALHASRCARPVVDRPTPAHSVHFAMGDYVEWGVHPTVAERPRGRARGGVGAHGVAGTPAVSHRRG